MKQLPITVVLDRLRSAHNVGNIFRICDAVHVQKIIGCGYTPMPGHPKLAKTAMGAEAFLSTEHVENALEAFEKLKNDPAIRQIIVVEPDENMICPWDFQWQFPCAVIFGNEAFGVDSQVREQADAIVGLPMLGGKESINVGNCAAVVLYGAYKAFEQQNKACTHD